MGNFTYIGSEPIHFSSIIEKPQLDWPKKLTIALVSSAVLVMGLLINSRIYKILAKRSNAAAMDQLLKFNNLISLVFHPIILGYYILSQYASPASDYIGVVGCLLSVHFIDPFTRFYNFTFPIAVALLRYLFVVEHMKIKARGTKCVVNSIIATTIIVPLFMTISVQFPISENSHGPYLRCIGRFETEFKPMDPDPFTPGLRGGSTHCTETGLWGQDPEASGIQISFEFALWLGCKVTTSSMWIILFGLPEIVLYSLTFAFIKHRTNQTALSGILRPDVIKKRRKQNTLNLIMTFWTWIAQLITNIFYIIVMKVFYGRDRFVQLLFAAFTVCLNFNVLPLFYVVLADADFKSAMMKKDVWTMLKIFVVCFDQLE